jgi:hypothetical protein
LNNFFIGVRRSIFGQFRLPSLNEQEFGSILTTPGMATVIALICGR